jgi:hypothetical protein
MFDTDVMDRVSLLYEWRNDSVNALQLLIRDCKTLAAFATYSFIFLLSILGVIEMAPQLAAMSLRTSVADIRRLQKSKAMTLYVFSTEFITILDAGATVLAEPFATRFADISIMLTCLAIQTGIECICLNNFDMTLDFL